MCFKKIKNFFSKKKLTIEISDSGISVSATGEDEKEVGWIEDHIVQEYRDNGGIPIRGGKYTKTFLKWYDDNY